MSTPFLTYVKTEIPNHLKVIVGLAIAGAFIFGYNKIRDLEAKLAAQAQVSATVSQKYQQAGTSAISGNTLSTASTVSTQAGKAFGSDVTSYMQQQGAKIQSLTTVVSQQSSQISSLQATLLPFLNTQVKTTSTSPSYALQGYTLEQSSRALPLTSVNLFYDPTQTNPALAFKGTQWTNYGELFTATVGSWQKKSDGGYKTSVSMTRTITKPDPTDPTKTITVGTEVLPITGSDTVYTPSGLVPPVVIPRWTASFGISAAPSFTVGTPTAYLPAASLDYRITSRFGLFAGTANKALTGGFSYRFSK